MKRASFLLGLWFLAHGALAADRLVILSPHRKSIQQEYLPKFKDYYQKKFGTEVSVEWLDQGGTSDDVRFLRAKYGKGAKSSGVDLFWGGGATTYMDLEDEDILSAYKLPAELAKQLPEQAAGVALRGKGNQWYGAAMSSFGVFYNRMVLKFEKLEAPAKWSDLAHPSYAGRVILADPRRSGTASAMNHIIIQGEGWDKGWDLLTRTAANVKKFTHSSSDPIKAVVAGDAAVAMAVDFYAMSKIFDLGPKALGFTLPEGQTILDPDPIAILKGAPNRLVAERFVNYVLSAEGQKLLILPKGTSGGPRFASLGRMAVNTQAYQDTKGKRISDFNPFAQKAFLNLDVAKASKLRRIFNDMIGALLVDTHSDLVKAWRGVISRGLKDQEVRQLVSVPVTEAQALKMAERWKDDVFRNKTINGWVAYAREKYQALAAGKKFTTSH